MNIPGLGVGLKAFLAANAPADLASVLCALAEASLPVAHLIRRGSLGGALDAAVGPAHDGVAQKALDVFADKAFVDGLKGSGVRGVVSEERDGPVAIDRDGTLLVAIDPLDGSSNIDANVTIGTVFSVLDAPAGEVEGAPIPAAWRTPARRWPRGLRAPRRLRLHHRGRRPHCDSRSRYKRISGLGRRRQDSGGVERVCDQRSKLSPLARTGAALYRGSSRRRRRAAQAQLQHALDRLDGRRRLPHSDPWRCLSIP